MELNRLFIGLAMEFDTSQEWGSTLARKREGGALERDYSMIGRLASAAGGMAQAWLRYGDRLVIQEI